MLEVYQFKKRRTKKIDLKNKPVEDIKVKKPKDDEIGLIQGVMPDSKEEYWVSIALHRLGLDFIYQYSIMGGSLLRGGQIVDFLVYTAPLPTPLQVQGTYWHGGKRNAQTQLNVARINNYFAGEAHPAIEIWDEEIPNKETAYLVVKRKLL